MKKSALMFSVEFTEDKYNAVDSTRRGERDLGAAVRIAVVAEIGTGLWSVVRVGRRAGGWWSAVEEVGGAGGQRALLREVFQLQSSSASVLSG